MCGIIGYVGHRACKDLLLQGLERLEYRGYDSAGLALLENGALEYDRAVGNLVILRLREHPNQGLGAGGAHEHAAPAVEFPIQPLHLL